MSSKQRRKKLNALLQQGSITPETTKLDPRVAFKEPLLFNFSKYVHRTGQFDCSNVAGSVLSVLMDLFKLFSQIDRGTIVAHYPHCHLIEESEVKHFHLDVFFNIAPTRKLFQIGKHAHPERIIGYFTDTQPNVFQVCFIDLYHQLYPSD